MTRPRRWARARYGPADIYRRAARQGAATRNPVIVLPGVLGTRLVDPRTGRAFWGGRRRDYARQAVAEEVRLIAHPMREGATLPELASPLVPEGAIRQVPLRTGGLSLHVDAYGSIMRALGIGGYVTGATRRGREAPDYGTESLATCFEFDYDWRLSLDQTARRLMRFIESVIRYAHRESGCAEPGKVDVVAHSMGGLALRYMLRYGDQLLREDGGPPALTWAGADLVEHAILVGTPNAGSISALDSLVAGLRRSAVFPRVSPAILGTLPSIYQLMPRPRHGALVTPRGERFDDLYDPLAWVEHRWGITDPRWDALLTALVPDVHGAAGRRRVALDHLRKCLIRARGFHDALDRPADAPRSVNLHLFAGDCHATPSVAAARPGQPSLDVLDYGPGDKTVLRASAIMDERGIDADGSPRTLTPIRWDGVTFVAADHLGLTRHPTFVNSTLFTLLEKPRPTCRFREASPDPGFGNRTIGDPVHALREHRVDA